MEIVPQTTPYYKVLKDGKSFHGGNMPYSLPVLNGEEWIPGEWHEVNGDIQVCHRGLHLTNSPVKWYAHGATVFLSEFDGEAHTDGSDKIAVCKCRLLRQLSDSELVSLKIFVSGEHTISEGKAFASGSATVRAYGSATVEASGSATVEAYGSPTVEAYGSATVRAYDSATVRAYGSATVRAYDSATVEAYGSATVEASGSATVEASGSATVRAYDSPTVEAYGSATVRAYDSATVRASGCATVEAFGSATVRAYDFATVRAYGSATVEAYGSATVTSTQWHNGEGVTTLHKAVWIDRSKGAQPVIVVGGVTYSTAVSHPHTIKESKSE